MCRLADQFLSMFSESHKARAHFQMLHGYWILKKSYETGAGNSREESQGHSACTDSKAIHKQMLFQSCTNQLKEFNTGHYLLGH